MRKLQDKLKDFEGLVNTVQDTVPHAAVRKLYKIAKDLATELDRLEGALANVEQVAETLKPFPDNESIYADQIREMTEEISALNGRLKEIEILEAQIAELKSDKWYTPIWNDKDTVKPGKVYCSDSTGDYTRKTPYQFETTNDK